MAPRGSVRPTTFDNRCEDCEPLVAAINGHAAAMREVAQAVARAGDHLEVSISQIAPVGVFFGEATARLDKLCAFIKRWGPWLLGVSPLVLMAMGAITPNAAAGLKTLLAAFTGH